MTDSIITLTREFDAPRELLFKVWTDPFHLAHWWVPYGFKSKVIEMDIRVGGTFHIELTAPDGNKYPSKGVFQDIQAPEKIVLLGDANPVDACGAGLPPNALITINFEEVNGKSKLSLHTEFETVETREAATAAGFNGGWASALDALSDYLSTTDI